MRPLLFLIIIAVMISGKAYGDEWVDYKQWVFVNHSVLIERVNHGESYGAYIVSEDYKPMIMADCFGYTDYQALVSKWKDKRPPVGIYAFYLENKSKLWNHVGNKVVVE